MSSTDDSEGGVGVLLLTVQQAAALCQISTDKVYEWTRLEGFPVVRGPHQVRIHARLFEDWLERRALEGSQNGEAQEDAA